MAYVIIEQHIKTYILMRTISILITLFLTSCLTSTDSNKNQTYDTVEKEVTIDDSSLLRYEIAEKKDISFAGTSRMVYRVVLNVTNLPSENEMKATAKSIWENGNRNWGEFTVFMYLPEMDVEWVAYGIGEFRPSGLLEFKINESALIDTKWYVEEDKNEQTYIGEDKKKEYRVNIDVNEEDNRTLALNIKTNFPDGTNLYVSIGRNHYLKGKSELYSGNLFGEDIKVQNGSINTKVAINDFKWHSEYQDLIKALPDDFPPISKISDSVTIRIMFSPLRDQSEEILRILGKSGEFITGEGVEEHAKFNSFSIEEDFYLPFRK